MELGPRRPRHDRAHPAPPYRRPHRRRARRGRAGHPAGRGRRLEGALHRPGEPGRHLRQADDGRHPARRDPDRPRAARVRHDHHRRGPRAVPQHRLPAGLPRPAAAQAARPQGRHHLRDHRPRALLPALRGRPDRRGQRADVSGRGALPAAPRRGRRRLRPRPDHRDLRRRRGAPGRGQGRHPRLPLRRAGDPRHRGRARRRRTTASPRCCRSTPGSRTPSSTASSSSTPAAGSFWRPTSPRPP